MKPTPFHQQMSYSQICPVGDENVNAFKGLEIAEDVAAQTASQ